MVINDAVNYSVSIIQQKILTAFTYLQKVGMWNKRGFNAFLFSDERDYVIFIPLI
jgi:hypothetical protein